MNYFVGFDIGGTKIEVSFLKENTSESFFQERVPTQRDLGYEHILKQISKLYKSSLIKTGISSKKITHIGLAMPGTVCPKKKMMTFGNTRVLENKDIISDLRASLEFQNPIYIENDANCFAFAEYHLGLKIKNSSLLGIILGTGVGGGFVYKDKIWSGSRGSFAEIGHLALFEPYSTCYCGQSGCVEQHLSGKGLEEEYFLLKKIKSTSTEILRQREMQLIYKKKLARFIGNAINTLDPEYIVIGGGISRENFIYENLLTNVSSHLFNKNDPPSILKHKISDSSGSLGAALLHLNS